MHNHATPVSSTLAAGDRSVRLFTPPLRVEVLDRATYETTSTVTRLVRYRDLVSAFSPGYPVCG